MMIELRSDTLQFYFPEVHANAVLSVTFQRTLRIPDDGKDYALPPGLGQFPLRHVDDFARAVPASWIHHGGVMLPMYQSEALWLDFSSSGGYPFAIKVATGKINAVTAGEWSDPLQAEPQDYLVAPLQPWLDGYCVEKGLVRQFVAMPLGAGYTAEEQITEKADHGGLQIVAYPMKREAYERCFGSRQEQTSCDAVGPAEFSYDMGLAPGGRMRQEIYEDRFGINEWDRQQRSRCFVHLANSLVWRSITGEQPPTVPFTAKEYTDAGLPWFEFYAEDAKALDGSKA